MKPWAESFYKSKAWQQCRNGYAKSVGGLCEICYRDYHRIVPGEIVHHKVHISPDNVSDPNVTLNWDNLELVCRECHERIHKGIQRRYSVDSLGRVTALR